MGAPKPRRTFKVKDSHVIQEPEMAVLGQFMAESDGIKGVLVITSYLTHLGVVSLGEDWFDVTLSIEILPRVTCRKETETFTISRDMQTLPYLRNWLLQLESSIQDGLLWGAHDREPRGFKNRSILRVLLSLADQTKPLDEEVRIGKDGRKRMLNSCPI